MDDFSTGDRVRAVLSPLACCLPTCRLAASPSSESLNNNNTDAPTAWYAQSRPEGSRSEANVPGNWEDAEERASRREADLLSLHEGVVGAGTARRRWTGRGGDISGSGSVAGSGLSRWTLLRSWWTGRGAVRLADSDDEGDDRVLTDEEDGQLTFDEAIASHGDGDADARPLPASFFPQTPPTPTTAPEPAEETAEERAQRRAQRRARRRARELGLSIEEFDGGAAAEPGELLVTPLLDVPTGSRSRGARTAASSSSGGSTDPDFVLVDTNGSRHLANGSHGFDWTGAPSPVPLTPVEDDGGMDGGDELFGREKEKKERRSRRKRGTDEGGSSHSGDGTRRGVGSSTGSSGHSHSRSSRSQASTAHTSILASQVPLPSSPSQSHYSHSSPDPNRPRNRHRSHPSTSTTSTSASSSGRRRTKTHASQLPDQAELPESPQYYQDANGQIQPFPVHQGQPGQWFVDDAGQHVFVPLAALAPHQQQQQQPQPYYPSPLDFSLPHDVPQNSYDHIGTLAPILPIPSSLPLDVAAPLEELEEELADTTLTPTSTALASTPPADPLEFLKALKRTKLTPATPTAVLPTPAVKVTSDSDENPLLDQWEGLGKGAATRSTWEGAGEVEGAEGSHWRSAMAGSEEDESEDTT
ncbi:hypothetical protein RQP46_001705 [Phenoliferia psychrophenolica]